MSATNGSSNGRRRVVITGLGALTPLGNDVRSTWDALISGASGAGPITQFDTTGCHCEGEPDANASYVPMDPEIEALP